MCTAIGWQNGDLYFGRNMDISFDFDRKIVVTPRNYPLYFKEMPPMDTHYAMIGTAMVVKDYPLFAEAVNEKGVYMAGLNFPGLASYNKSIKEKQNITVNEFIPWVLGKCSKLSEVLILLKQINITSLPFMEGLPIPTLHFIIGDKSGSVVVECMAGGMYIHDNPTNVMTNNPKFDIHLHNLNNYMALSAKSPANSLTNELELNHYCLGMGALGLPGDFSSESRFVKAFFLKTNSVADQNEASSVSQMFRILDGVGMIRGAVIDEDGKHDITVYSSCINADKGIYYYKTYDSSLISAVYMHNENLAGDKLSIFPHECRNEIFNQN